MPEREDKYVRAAVLASARGVQGAALTFTDEAYPWVAELMKKFPSIKRRALGKAGSTVRKWGRAAMEGKDAPGTGWRKTSAWEEAKRRIKAPRRSRFSSSQREALREKFFAGKRGGERPYGKLYSTSRYILAQDGNQVDVGWVTYDAARYGRSVQGGLRGASAYAPEFDGEQPVSSKMRRALAAAGLVLSRGKMFLKQPERSLWEPLFGRALEEIPRVMEDYMAEKIGAL